MNEREETKRPLAVVAITPTGFMSGAEMVLVCRAGTGTEAGDHWTVLAPTGAVTDRLAANGVAHHTIPELKLGPGRRPVAAAKLLWRNLRAVPTVRRATRGADVIVANSVLCLPVLRLARPSAPVVWLVHDVITRGDLARIARSMASVVTCSVAVSQAAGALSEQIGIPTVVVYNGVNVDPEPNLDPSEPPIIGLNAVLTHWKGQHVLLDAVGRLGGSVQVELLGGTMPKDEDYERQLRQRAEQPDLAGRVRFLGHRDCPSEVMRHWTVGVSASVEPEAGPLSVLEGMALGLPMIVSDHGGAPEIVGDHGVVVPVNDPDALARAISDLLGDRDGARRLGQAARQRVAADFGRAELGWRFRTVLREMADGRRRRPGR